MSAPPVNCPAQSSTRPALFGHFFLRISRPVDGWGNSSGEWNREDDSAREAAPNLDFVHHPVLPFVQLEQQAPNFVRNLEVCQLNFRSRSLILVELYIYRQSGRWSEDWRSISHVKILDLAAINGLARPNQGLARGRELREA